MERKFLEDLGLDKTLVDKILDVNSADIGKHKGTAETAAAKITELTGQLAQRDSDITELKKADAAGLQTKLTDLEQKYSNERAAWGKQDERRTYEMRRNEFFTGTDFTDVYAKRGIIAEFDEQEFKFNDTDKTFIGAGEWLNKVKETAGTAFKSETKAPYVVRPTGNASNTELTKEQFNKLGYAARLALKRENLEQYNILKE